MFWSLHVFCHCITAQIEKAKPKMKIYGGFWGCKYLVPIHISRLVNAINLNLYLMNPCGICTLTPIDDLGPMCRYWGMHLQFVEIAVLPSLLFFFEEHINNHHAFTLSMIIQDDVCALGFSLSVFTDLIKNCVCFDQHLCDDSTGAQSWFHKDINKLSFILSVVPSCSVVVVSHT